MTHIPILFLSFAADILADTSRGLSGNEVVKAFNAYAVEYNINIPHATYPFEASNKRTALLDNLKAFPASLQYKIIRDLCDHRTFANKQYDELKSLKVKLVSQFANSCGIKSKQTSLQSASRWLYLPSAFYQENKSIFIGCGRGKLPLSINDVKGCSIFY